MRALNACVAAILMSSVLLAPMGALHAETVLLRNGVIHTEGAQGTIEGGSILLVDGVVTAMGVDVVAPERATIIDLKGHAVTPALFGGVGHLGVIEVEQEHTTEDSTLHLGKMHPEFDPLFAFNPDSIPVEVSRVEGIGFAVLEPGATGARRGGLGSSVIAGLASVVRLDGRNNSSLKALSVRLGESAQSLAGDSRAGAYLLLSQAFEEARDPKVAASHEQQLLTPAGRRVLQSVLAGQKPVLFSVDRAADIRTVVEFSQREKLQAVVVGGSEAWRVAPLLASARIPVILDPLDDLPESFDRIGSTLENAARLHRAGVAIAFSLRADSPHMERKLRQAAGNAVAHGLPWDVALAALTREPARIFHATHEYGSIATGRVANLVVWSGDPLEVTSLVEASWLNGQRISLQTRQTALRDRYLEKVRSGTAR